MARPSATAKPSYKGLQRCKAVSFLSALVKNSMEVTEKNSKIKQNLDNNDIILYNYGLQYILVDNDNYPSSNICKMSDKIAWKYDDAYKSERLNSWRYHLSLIRHRVLKIIRHTNKKFQKAHDGQHNCKYLSIKQ